LGSKASFGHAIAEDDDAAALAELDALDEDAAALAELDALDALAELAELDALEAVACALLDEALVDPPDPPGCCSKPGASVSG
jgi:hypothetical protein